MKTKNSTTIYENKEEAVNALRKNLGGKTATKSIKALLQHIKKKDLEESAYYYYNDYVHLKLLNNNKFDPYTIAYYKTESGKTAYVTMFDIVDEKPDNFKIKDLLADEKTYTTFAPSVLITYYIETKQYEEAAKVLATTLKNHDDTIYDITINPDGSDEQIILEKGYLFLLTIIYATNKYTKERVKVDYIDKYQKFLISLAKLSDNGIPKILENPTVAYMNRYVQQASKNRITTLRRNAISNGRNSTEATNLLECSDANIEYILGLFGNPDDNYYSYYIVNSKDDWRFEKFAKYFDSHKDEFEKVFKNYFYSKYGRGSKYNKLELRLYQFQKMLEVLNYDDITILDFTADLPDKIVGAALKGLVG